MTIESHELASIQQAAANALAAELLEYNLTPADVHNIGARVLGAIETAAGLNPDPRAFAPGRRVRSMRTGTPEQEGTVTRVVEERGEVHTVYVQWDGWPAAEPESPSVLELIP